MRIREKDPEKNFGREIQKKEFKIQNSQEKHPKGNPRGKYDWKKLFNAKRFDDLCQE
jgi:hypothetical protein